MAGSKLVTYNTAGHCYWKNKSIQSNISYAILPSLVPTSTTPTIPCDSCPSTESPHPSLCPVWSKPMHTQRIRYWSNHEATAEL